MEKKKEKRSRVQKVKSWLTFFCFLLMIFSIFSHHPVLEVILIIASFVTGGFYAVFSERNSDWIMAIICVLLSIALFGIQFPALFSQG
ncbi:MAG: hypothetical protein MUP45_04510 [Candidatus Marinimicrobia bacterium]|nr:hypothetical protein [Candidatus Neomarinimicrobiota bacterium]